MEFFEISATRIHWEIHYQGKVVSFVEAFGAKKKSSVYNINKVDRLIYPSTLPEKGWIFSKNHFIKPV